VSDPDGISLKSLALENQNPRAIIWLCLRDPAFSNFGTVLACDRQKKKWTHDDSICHARIASRGKNTEQIEK